MTISIVKVFAIAVLVVTGVLTIAHTTDAETVIRNNVNVSASSGGNQSENSGTIEAGEASVSLRIETTVGDQDIESVVIDAESQSGATAITKHIATSSSDGSLRVETAVSVEAIATSTGDIRGSLPVGAVAQHSSTSALEEETGTESQEIISGGSPIVQAQIALRPGFYSWRKGTASLVGILQSLKNAFIYVFSLFWKAN